MRSLRIVFALVAFTLALLALLAGRAHGAEVPPPPDITFLTQPRLPCQGELVSLLAVVPDCPPCVEATSFGRLPSGGIALEVRQQRDCATFAPCANETLSVGLGTLASGYHSVFVLVRVSVFGTDSVPDTTYTLTRRVDFTVGTACGPGQLPFVSDIRIGAAPCDTCPPVACPGQPIPLRIDGQFPNSCWRVRSAQWMPSITTVIGPPTLRILLDDQACLGMPCLMVPQPWSLDTLRIPPLPGGNYALPIEVGVVSCSDSIPPGGLYGTAVPFQVESTCPPLLPYIGSIQIGPPAPCDTCPSQVCPYQPFPVRLAGVLPDDCVQFLKVELVPDPRMDPMPHPPVVRVTFAVNDCMRRVCVDGPFPWEAGVLLPGLPPGEYPLVVEAQGVSMCDSSHVLGSETTVRPFTVLGTCDTVPPPPSCLRESWSPDGLYRPCDAYLVGDSASADLRIASPVALAGLQGVLRVQSGLEVIGLEPIGPAAGMNLQWVREGAGARFVLFATGGAPIPPASWPDDTSFTYWPVLRVKVLASLRIPEEPPAPVLTMYADSLLGSDINGQGIESCLTRCLTFDDPRCYIPIARFCRPTTCDANHDGRGDVRDLVLMVNCILGGAPCPDTTQAPYDCDGDRHADIDDVICCALAMLRGAPPDSAPPPSGAVSLRFDEPRREGDLLIVPLHLDGTPSLGAARLAFRFPSDRYATATLAAPLSPGWLVVSEVQGGEVVGGVIGLGARTADLTLTLPLELRLTLRAGAEHGGAVELASSELAGIDGAALGVLDVPPGVVLDPSAPMALSAVQPNPTSGAAQVTLTLPRAAEVEVAVHDLAGRRVATLHHGRLEAGVRTLTWSGRVDSGEAARDGVYFVRARAEGVEVARKMVLMRGR